MNAGAADPWVAITPGLWLAMVRELRAWRCAHLGGGAGPSPFYEWVPRYQKRLLRSYGGMGRLRPAALTGARLPGYCPRSVKGAIWARRRGAVQSRKTRTLSGRGVVGAWIRFTGSGAGEKVVSTSRNAPECSSSAT